jgi:peptide subunit release factor 1 (eRF1)
MIRPTKKQIQEAVAKLKDKSSEASNQKTKVGSMALKKTGGEIILKPYDHG